jgi:penicillin-binding protein 1C
MDTAAKLHKLARKEPSVMDAKTVVKLTTIGGAEVLQQRLQACGLTTLTRPAEEYGLGLTIGNAEARLLELANAYACLARLGSNQPFNLVLNAGFHGGDSSGDRRLLVDRRHARQRGRTMAFGPESPLRLSFWSPANRNQLRFPRQLSLCFCPGSRWAVGNFDRSPMTRFRSNRRGADYA